MGSAVNGFGQLLLQNKPPPPLKCLATSTSHTKATNECVVNGKYKKRLRWITHEGNLNILWDGETELSVQDFKYRLSKPKVTVRT